LTSSYIRFDILKRGELREHPEAQLGGPSFNWAYQSCKAARRSIAQAHNIKVPVLLVQASDDRVLKPGGQKKFCDAVNRSDVGSCRLERVDGARHDLLIESDQYRNAALSRTIKFFRAKGQF